MKKIDALNAEGKKQLNTLTEFINIFCRENHPALKEKALCPDCQNLIAYSTKRFLSCPYNPKPKCKDCATHCYQSSYRQQIKQVMKFSGRYLIKRGRLDVLAHYLF